MHRLPVQDGTLDQGRKLHVNLFEMFFFNHYFNYDLPILNAISNSIPLLINYFPKGHLQHSGIGTRGLMKF